MCAANSSRNKTIAIGEADMRYYSGIKGIEQLRLDVAGGHYLNNIYNADSLEALAVLPQGCVDLIFADPPYNLGKNFGNNIDRRGESEYYAWNESWIKECRRVLKQNGSIYICCDWKYSGMFQKIISDYFIIQNRITWKREKGRGSKVNWKNNMEDIWFATASESYTFNIEEVKIKKEIIAPYKINGKPKDWIEKDGEKYRMTHPSNIWVDMVVPFWSMGENTTHPTQKPEKLLERVVKASSRSGEKVLDPFMGSGTTAAVSSRLKRDYIGFEVNKDYIALAGKRIARQAEGGEEFQW